MIFGVLAANDIIIKPMHRMLNSNYLNILKITLVFKKHGILPKA